MLTLSAVIASEVEWTLTVELASEVNACCRWRTRVFFAIYNVFITVLTYKNKISFSTYKHNECTLLSCNVTYQLHTPRLELTNYLSYVSNMFYLISKHKTLTYISLWYLLTYVLTYLLHGAESFLSS